MAQLGRKKTITRKRMTEFSPKSKSLVSKTELRIKQEKENLIHRVQRGVSKVATKEEAKKIYSAAKNVATSKEVKAVGKGIGSFLRGWARASQAAMERQKKR